MPRKPVILIVSMIASWIPGFISAQESVTVELAEVESGTLQETSALPGELLPFQQVELTAKVTGFVEDIRVDRGSRVGKGDLIAQLSAPELDARKAEAQAQVASAEADLAEADARLAASQSTYERLSKAAETPGVVAGNDLIRTEKTAEADRARVAALTRSVEAARAALASVEQMTAYLRVTAPFGGVVTERSVHIGSLTGPGTAASHLRATRTSGSTPSRDTRSRDLRRGCLQGSRGPVFGLRLSGRDFHSRRLPSRIVSLSRDPHHGRRGRCR